MLFQKPGSRNWYYKFEFNGELIRKSAKTKNKRLAEQIETVARTRLIKGEVGIVEPAAVPSLAQFSIRFLKHVETANAAKPATVKFYGAHVAILLADKAMAMMPMDSFTSESLTAFVARRRVKHSIAYTNRTLATLRKMTRLLTEWDGTLCRPIRLLPGEVGRDRVVTPQDEAAYLKACSPLLYNVAICVLDCGFRPEEVHRLTWSQIRDGSVEIHSGKGDGSRRRIEMSNRVVRMLATLPRESEYVFPAPTKTGHIDLHSYRKQHAAALRASKVPKFVLYSLRHSAVTRLALLGLDAPALMYWAGHRSLSTTLKYVHMAADDVQKRVRAVRGQVAKGRPSFRPTSKKVPANRKTLKTAQAVDSKRG